MTTTMSNLTMDLVEEIVSWVPLKHMRAVRLTCKKWNAVFQSRSFTKMKIAKEEEKARELEESRMIVMMDYSIHLMSVVVNENPSTKSLGKLTFLNDSEKVKISQVYHCEGLLLCTVKDEKLIWKDDNTKIVVWNPYLGQTRWIQTSHNFSTRGYSYHSRELYDRYHYALGFGNKRGNRKPKILRFIDVYRNHPKNEAVLYEIYNLESDSWTSLDVRPPWCIRSERGVSLKGNTYWGAVKSKRFWEIDHIICFDFKYERFGPLLPLPFRAHHSRFASLSCVREEKLAALFQTIETHEKEIWITTNVEPTQVSWSHFFTVNMPSCFDWNHLYKSFLVDEEKKVAMVFDKQGKTNSNDLTHDRVDFIGEAGCFSQLLLGETVHEWRPAVCWPIVCSSVPSLVQIKRRQK